MFLDRRSAREFLRVVKFGSRNVREAVNLVRLPSPHWAIVALAASLIFWSTAGSQSEGAESMPMIASATAIRPKHEEKRRDQEAMVLTSHGELQTLAS